MKCLRRRGIFRQFQKSAAVIRGKITALLDRKLDSRDERLLLFRLILALRSCCKRFFRSRKLRKPRLPRALRLRVLVPV